MLKVNEIIEMQQLKIVLEFNLNSLPTDLTHLFKISKEIHEHETCSAHNNCLFIPSVKTTKYGINSLTYKGPVLWNKMSRYIPEINKIKNVKHFKSIIKEYYLSTYEHVHT